MRVPQFPSRTTPRPGCLLWMRIPIFLESDWSTSVANGRLPCATVLSQPQPEHCPVFLVSAVSCTHCPIPPFGREFKKAWQVYHPMRIGWAWRQWYATPSHRLMSLTGVSLGRPLSSRHCLRFARQPSRYATAASVFNCLCCRRSSRAASSLRSRSACISAWRPSSMSWGVT